MEVSRDSERDLWCAARGNASVGAREELFNRHRDFARNLGRRLCRERAFVGIDLLDIDQLAYAGLLDALDRFDHERGVPFRGFASPRISGTIIDGVSRMSEAREQISWRHRVRRERLRALEIADAEKLSPEEAISALTKLAVGLAVGFMLEGTGMYLDEAEQREPSAYDSLAWKTLVNSVQQSVAGLPERERAIVRGHYLDGVSFEHLAAFMGVGKSRISQLHRAALLRLQKALRQDGHFRLEQ